MKKIYKGSALFVSLMILSGLLALLFLTKENGFSAYQLTQHYYQQYLTEKFYLMNDIMQDHESICRREKKAEIIYSAENIAYQFSCQFSSIFKQPKPTKEKYIQVDNLTQVLDIETYRHKIYSIQSLTELPESTENDPKVVIALNDIDEALSAPFYGMVITEHYFDIRGKYKMFGVVYSTFNNQREERNLAYRRKVVDNIEKQFSQWNYLSHSKNLFNDESTF